MATLPMVFPWAYRQIVLYPWRVELHNLTSGSPQPQPPTWHAILQPKIYWVLMLSVDQRNPWMWAHSYSWHLTSLHMIKHSLLHARYSYSKGGYILAILFGLPMGDYTLLDIPLFVIFLWVLFLSANIISFLSYHYAVGAPVKTVLSWITVRPPTISSPSRYWPVSSVIQGFVPTPSWCTRPFVPTKWGASLLWIWMHRANKGIPLHV